MSGNNIQCIKCTHYHVTWDKRFPHGCRFWNVKSQRMPHIIVYESLGKLCEYFSEKKK